MEDKDGTFLGVDLQTSTGIAVAIVPHFWFSSNSCRYPYSPGDASEDEDEPTLSRAPTIPSNLWRHQQSPRFLPTHHLSNGSFVSNNNTANNSSTEHGPSVGYGHAGSPTHRHISSSGNSLPEHGPSTQYADPGSSNSYSNFGQSSNPPNGNIPSVRSCYPGSSGHELQYGNLGSSTSFSHPGLSPSIVRSQSSASIHRPGSSFSVDRPGSPASVAHPGLSASIVSPESSASIDRPGSSGSIGLPGSSMSQVDSGFSGEHFPPFATNGSHGHHSQPDSFRHLSQFEHRILPSPSIFRGQPSERRNSTSERSDTSEIIRSLGPTANALPARTLPSNQGSSDNGGFVGLSTRSIGKSPPADIMVRVFQSLEKIAEQQRVQDARLIAIDRRFDNLQQVQQQSPSNDPLTEIPGLPVKTLDELVSFENKIKDNDKFFEFVRFIRTVGGTSTANVVIRSWIKVLTLDAKASCNWLGKVRNGQRKHALKDSRVTKAIFKGIRGTPQFRAVQESELIVETKKALKHAPEKVRQVAAAAAAAAAAGAGDDATATATGSEED